jgi:hypothetical protein
MLYAAYATPIGAVCHSTVNKVFIPKNIKVGMCFMSPNCEIDEQVTCHRYKAANEIEAQGIENKIHKPIRNININGYYRVYSSMFDGNISDTYMR